MTAPPGSRRARRGRGRRRRADSGDREPKWETAPESEQALQPPQGPPVKEGHLRYCHCASSVQAGLQGPRPRRGRESRLYPDIWTSKGHQEIGTNKKTCMSARVA
ncbi:uncharacterized protein LOC144576988 isoform X2 [Callithrix jacchus]